MCSTRKIMFKILLPALLLLIPFTAKAELEITIYGFRTSNDLAYKTYSYEVIEPKEIENNPSLNVVPTPHLNSNPRKQSSRQLEHTAA